MKTSPILVVSSVLILLVACGKDKFESKPRLEIKSYSGKEIFPGQVMSIKLNYFDKEGDLSTAPFTGIVRRQNLLPISPSQDVIDTIIVPLPEFPVKDQGEISFDLPYSFLKESTTENDTLKFRFSVVDNAGNESDTVVTDQVVIILQ